MQTAVADKATIIQRLDTYRDEIHALGVKQLGLFGSFVKNTQNNTSDIDLMVEFEPGKKTFDNFMSLSIYLEELLGRDVELVTPQSLNKYIGPYIIKELEHVFR